MSEEESMFGHEPKPTQTGSVTVNGVKNKPKINLTKWFALGVGGLLGLSYIGMVGMVVNKSKNQLPDLDIPVGTYTSYVVQQTRMDIRSVIQDLILRQHTLLRTSSREGWFLRTYNRDNQSC